MMEASTRTDIEWQCINLNRAFAYYNDNLHESGSAEKLALLFSPDGVFDAGPDGIAHGREEIRQWALNLLKLRPAGIVLRHTLPNFFFTQVDNETAEAVIYNMTYSAQGEPGKGPAAFSSPHGFMITLKSNYRNTSEGWRIATMHAEVTMVPKG